MDQRAGVIDVSEKPMRHIKRPGSARASGSSVQSIGLNVKV